MAPSPDHDLVAKLGTILTSDAVFEKLCEAPSNLDIIVERSIGRGALWYVYQGTLWRNAPTNNVRVSLQPPSNERQHFRQNCLKEDARRSPDIDCSMSSRSNGSNLDSDDSSSTYPSPVAIKVCYVNDFDDSDPELSMSSAAAHESARHEVQVYERARQLGLDALVNLHAAYRISARDGQEAYLMVLDLCGPAIDPAALRASDLYVRYQWSFLPADVQNCDHWLVQANTSCRPDTWRRRHPPHMPKIPTRPISEEQGAQVCTDRLRSGHIRRIRYAHSG